MDDYYKVLGIKQFASQEEIKKAYRLLAKRWHPDLNQGDDNSAEVFKRINEAYYVLSKPALKSDYDYYLQGYLNAKKEVEQFDYSEKEEKEAENNLYRFTQKMKGAFENLIYEDEDSPTTLNKRFPNHRIIDEMRIKAKKMKNRIVDLIYEDIDD